MSKNMPFVSIINLFEQHAEQQPAATALVCGSDRLSYKQHNQYANKLSLTLSSKLQKMIALRRNDYIDQLQQWSVAPNTA
jgi:non-ribosomal peptide synthetase component F